MDTLLDVFDAIDVNSDGRITTDQLQHYVKMHDLDPEMIERWKALFDPNNTGVITLETFKDTLGLQGDERINPETGLLSNAGAPQVEIISEDIDQSDKQKILEKMKELTAERKPLEGKEVASMLKVYLDETFGRCWHVVVTEKSAWIKISHFARHALFCRMDGCTYIIWMTPVVV
ncbi:unnamed protein product [Calicophoron daubneyi]|uniref:EF-hand domain-containing protein n=1 Tax=Calicophoron daubneyi TaxID=300641 RepID=A0AAV2TX33_CALDB